MEQTNHYQLNLIELTDRFTPEPLNENAETVDDALNTHDAAIAALDAGKADADDLTALAARVGTLESGKADSTAVSAEATARQNAVSGEAAARQSADTALQGNIDAEATARQSADTTLQSNITAEATARAAAISALTAAVGTQGHTCRLAWGTYSGTGSFGSGSPNSLTFPFTPYLVTFGTEYKDRDFQHPTMLIRGMTSCRCETTDNPITVSWNNKTVSWYSATNAQRQSNESGKTYRYVAFGSDDT